MADYLIKDTTLSDIANAIRGKTGQIGNINVSDFAEEISGIETGGGENIELLENISVVLDFSNGNQTIEAPEGFAVKSAIIQKPKTLLPENIEEGVNIAGIIGTLAGSTSAKIAYGTFTGTGARFTLNHNLGVVPDIVLVFATYASQRELASVYGFSSAFIEKMGLTTGQVRTVGNGDNAYGYATNSATVPLEKISDEYALTSVNETSIYVGGVSYGYTKNGWSYQWIAIGGLT